MDIALPQPVRLSLLGRMLGITRVLGEKAVMINEHVMPAVAQRLEVFGKAFGHQCLQELRLAPSPFDPNRKRWGRIRLAHGPMRKGRVRGRSCTWVPRSGPRALLARRAPVLMLPPRGLPSPLCEGLCHHWHPLHDPTVVPRRGARRHEVATAGADGLEPMDQPSLLLGTTGGAIRKGLNRRPEEL